MSKTEAEHEENNVAFCFLIICDIYRHFCRAFTLRNGHFKTKTHTEQHHASNQSPS